MALTAWPVAELNLRVMQGTYREDYEDGIDSFAVDHGPPLENAGVSVPTFLISYEASFTALEYERLIEFYRDDVARVNPFTMPHPRTAVPAQIFRFTAAPKLISAAYSKKRVALALRHFPGV